MNIAASSSIVILDAFELRRAGIAALIWPWATTVNAVLLAFSPDELQNMLPPKSPPLLVILSVGGLSLQSGRACDWVSRIRVIYSGVPCVVLSDLSDPQEAVLAARMGEQAFLSNSVDPHIAMQACALVASGGTYFPSEALQEIWSAKGAAQPHAFTVGGLTVRQLEVLKQLRLGHSNKMIARELSMRESTVKVHVREIMRKLGTRNRTEAAMLANGNPADQPTVSGDEKLDLGAQLAEPHLIYMG